MIDQHADIIIDDALLHYGGKCTVRGCHYPRKR